jgi:hypothetical protein
MWIPSSAFDIQANDGMYIRPEKELNLVGYINGYKTPNISTMGFLLAIVVKYSGAKLNILVRY